MKWPTGWSAQIQTIHRSKETKPASTYPWQIMTSREYLPGSWSRRWETQLSWCSKSWKWIKTCSKRKSWNLPSYSPTSTTYWQNRNRSSPLTTSSCSKSTKKKATNSTRTIKCTTTCPTISCCTPKCLIYTTTLKRRWHRGPRSGSRLSMRASWPSITALAAKCRSLPYSFKAPADWPPLTQFIAGDWLKASPPHIMFWSSSSFPSLSLTFSLALLILQRELLRLGSQNPQLSSKSQIQQPQSQLK